MMAAEFREVLERLELAPIAAARRLDVDPRTVRRWLVGRARIPDGVAEIMRGWLEEREQARSQRVRARIRGRT